MSRLSCGCRYLKVKKKAHSEEGERAAAQHLQLQTCETEPVFRFILNMETHRPQQRLCEAGALSPFHPWDRCMSSSLETVDLAGE